MILALGNSFWICLRVSIPFKPGSWISIRVTSGRCARNFSMASSPVAASSTHFISFSLLTRAAIPLRRRGWSSTVRIRIRPGSMLMISNPLKQSEFGGPRTLSVGYRSINGQLNFCSGTRFAPNIQFRAHLLCSFSNTWQTPVSTASAFLQHVWVHAFSIVPDTQPKLVVVVQNLSLDLLRLCVPKGITQHLTRDAVNFSADDRS